MDTTNNRQAKRPKKSSTMSGDDDTTIYDAARTSGHGRDQRTIRDKMGRLLSEPGYETFLNRSEFTLLRLDTKQLRSLQTAEAHPIEICAGDTDCFLAERGEERDKLSRYTVTVYRSRFLDLACKPGSFYVREGYKELYAYVLELWKSKNLYHVVLLGNAGTGKSWFQVYALQQLMSCDKREYDFVIRQVGSNFSLIDLDEAIVYSWNTRFSADVYKLFNALKRTLYFFEPGSEGNRPPLDVSIPSLATLSPCIPRIKEYKKGLCKILYFWPWSSGELRAVLQDSELGINEETFSDRYHKFGGVLRHVLREMRDAERELEGQLSTIDIGILTSTALNIEGDIKVHTVNGFLICYDNRSSKGKERFAERNLLFTSPYVEEKVQSRILTRPIRDSMTIVLERLHGTKIDIAGKNLERAAIELLSKGNKFEWTSKEIGSNQADWEVFTATARTIIVEFGLVNFDQPGNINWPSSKTFPVVDFVYSRSEDARPVVAFQCTWRKGHSVSLHALCTLRRKYMKISDDQLLEIYIVCPEHEALYARRKKQDFVVGKLDRDLKLETKTTLNPTELDTMWRHTKLFVIRPKYGWQRQIEAYFSDS